MKIVSFAEPPPWGDNGVMPQTTQLDNQPITPVWGDKKLEMG
jgi:hypothetical protein